MGGQFFFWQIRINVFLKKCFTLSKASYYLTGTSGTDRKVWLEEPVQMETPKVTEVWEISTWAQFFQDEGSFSFSKWRPSSRLNRQSAREQYFFLNSLILKNKTQGLSTTERKSILLDEVLATKVVFPAFIISCSNIARFFTGQMKAGESGKFWLCTDSSWKWTVSGMDLGSSRTDPVGRTWNQEK